MGKGFDLDFAGGAGKAGGVFLAGKARKFFLKN